MLIKCCFAITVMLDTISSTSSRSSLKFPSTFGTVHHVLLQHLEFYSDHATLFPAQVWGGYIRISFQPPLVHCIYICVHLFLVEQFLPLASFSLFVQQSLLWIYTFTTSYVTTLHFKTISGKLVEFLKQVLSCHLFPPLGYGQIYCITFHPPGNHK